MQQLTISNAKISALLLGEWSLFLGRQIEQRGRRDFCWELNPYKTHKAPALTLDNVPMVDDYRWYTNRPKVKLMD